MDATTVEKLTQEYLQNAKTEWGKFDVRHDNVSVSLKDVFTLLKAQEVVNHKENALVELSRVINQANNIVLLGEPGSGKSTIMKFFCLYFAGEEWTSKYPTIKGRQKFVPILIPLQKFMTNDYDQVRDVVITEIRSFLDEEVTVFKDLYNEWTRDNGVYQTIFLFDGFDELDNKKSDIQDKLQRFANTNTGKRSRIIISSRITGFEKFSENFKQITLEPLRNKEEREGFLAKWLTALGSEQPEREANNLLRELLLRPALNTILDNPLSLQMIAETYHNSKELPSNRADIYEKYFYRIAKQRRLDFENGSTLRLKAKTALMAIAWHIHTIGERKKETLINAVMGDANKDDNARELFALVYDKLNIISEQNNGFKFHHERIQDYFVAERLKDAWKNDSKATWKFIRPRLHLPKWKEPLSLLFAGLDEKNKVNFIAKVKAARSRYENKLHRDYFLAATLIGENGVNNKQLIKPFLDQARSWLIPKRGRAIIALGCIGGEEALQSVLKKYSGENEYDSAIASYAVLELDEKSFSTFSEYLIQNDLLWKADRSIMKRVVDINGQKGVEALVQLIKNRPYHLTREALFVLSDRREASVVPFLIQALYDENDRIVENSVKALSKFHSDAIPYFSQVLDKYKGDNSAVTDEEAKNTYRRAGVKNSTIRSWICEALGNIGSSECIPDLLQLLETDKDDGVKRAASEALAKVGDISVIQKVLSLEKPPLWFDTHKVLVNICSRQEISLLLALLRQCHEKKNWMQDIIIESLGDIGDKNALPDLVEIALKEYSQFGDIRNGLIVALGKFQLIEVNLPILNILEKDISYNNRRYINEHLVPALGNIGDARSIPALKSLINNRTIWGRTRIEAIYALGKINDTFARNNLIEILHGESENLEGGDIRAYAIHALSNFKDLETIDLLTPYLFNENGKFSDAAADALSNMGSQAIPSLAKALHVNLQWFTQETVVKALGNFHNIQSTELLVEALTNDDAYIRAYAAEALGNICDSVVDNSIIEAIKAKAAPILIELLKNSREGDNKHHYIMVLGKIDALKAIEFFVKNPNKQDAVYYHKAIDTIGEIGEISAIDNYLIGIIKQINNKENTTSYVSERAIINILHRWQSIPNKARQNEDKERFARIVRKLDRLPSSEIHAIISEIQDDFIAPTFDPLDPPSRPIWQLVALLCLIAGLIGVLTKILNDPMSLLWAFVIGIILTLLGLVAPSIYEKIYKNREKD
jgi:HEAT repeat protein